MFNYKGKSKVEISCKNVIILEEAFYVRKNKFRLHGSKWVTFLYIRRAVEVRM